MEILNSSWLIKMLEKSSITPHGRLLALFDILEDWLDAPNVDAPSIREQLNGQFSKPKNAKLLQDYLSAEAAKAGAAMPEVLANQLYFMAVSAIQERLQVNIHAGAGREAFNHAKSAANALITAQTKKEFYIAKPAAYAIAASFLAMFIAAATLLVYEINQSKKIEALAALQPTLQPAMQLVSAATPLTASPEQTAKLMAEIEQMRHGNCQLIEAIQLPDKLKGVYINMVVHGEVSTDPQEQEIAMDLIKKTRCNYTPMLMANSK
jgi:hypothetical protein